jgi:DNA-binding transcriptional MocR family regulator
VVIDWNSELPIGQGKRYKLLADGLAEAIASGRLEPGSQLPTQRNLAHRLGISVSTVTRAYIELQQRGLIQSKVGSGSFVQMSPSITNWSRRNAGKQTGREGPRTPLETLEGPPQHARGLVDLSINEPLPGPAARCVQRGLADILAGTNVETLVGSQPVAGSTVHRQAGADWLHFIGVKAHPDEIVLVPGSQGCLAAVLMALCRNGETILTESLTWPGIIAVASIANVRIRAVGMDEGGLRPDELDRACRDGQPRILYTMPTLHNPTAITADLERREAIVRVARKHGLIIVEDDAYGFLPVSPLPSYFELLPENTIYLTSLSKAVAPAIRVGFVAAKAPLQRRLLPAFRATTMMTSPIVAEIAARLIASGAAREAAHEQAATALRRQMLADEILGPAHDRGPEPSMHRWLELDHHWDSMSFVSEALRLGVSVSAGPLFSAVPGVDPKAVRVCLSADPDERRVASALATLGGLARGSASARRVV